MLNKELEHSLNKAFHDANEKRHEFITVEHLLMMLTDNDAALAVLEACGGDVPIIKKELEIFVDQNTPLLMSDEDRDTQPTLGFQRVLQRALFHVQSSGNGEVSGANVLVAIFSEQDSHAVYLLNKHNIERLDVTNYLSHGITRVDDRGDHLGGIEAVSRRFREMCGALFEGCVHDFADVVDPAHGDDGVVAEVRTDDEGLVLGIADAPDPQAPLHLGDVIIELGPELGVFDVVDEAAEILRIPHRQSSAPGSEMRVEIGSIEEIEDTVLSRDDAEYTPHRRALSC